MAEAMVIATALTTIMVTMTTTTATEKVTPQSCKMLCAREGLANVTS
jgi:hypothetical protein